MASTPFGICRNRKKRAEKAQAKCLRLLIACGWGLVHSAHAAHTGCGGSGCGCSASVFNGYLLAQMREKGWKKLLFAPTGALLSPTSSFQGESIPGICHAIAISTSK